MQNPPPTGRDEPLASEIAQALLPVPTTKQPSRSNQAITPRNSQAVLARAIAVYSTTFKSNGALRRLACEKPQAFPACPLKSIGLANLPETQMSTF
jgi:hypothetical protein